MQVSPYLFFEGRCEEALEFYKQAVGAEVTFLMRYKENPDPQPGSMPPGAEDKVMHATFKVGDSLLHASDGHCQGNATYKGFSLSLTVATTAEADRFFGAVSPTKVRCRCRSPRLSSHHGSECSPIVFGVGWMVYVSQQ